MISSPITYNIANDTLNSKLDVDSLSLEIQNSSILVALDYIQSTTTDINIYFKSDITDPEGLTLDSVISAHAGISLEPEHQKIDIHQTPPFANKKITDANGDLKALFKRVHGLSVEIPPKTTGFLDFVVPYDVVKFTGAELVDCDRCDQLDFFVLDTPTNTISGLDVGTYGANFMLNQFGFNVKMPDGHYSNTSNYDADLIKDMVISCAYKNNSSWTKTVSMNVEIHEVK